MNTKKIETVEYLNYDKIPGCKKFEAVSKQFLCQIPKLETDGHTKLVGSCQSQSLTIKYYLRCFTKVKSIFEVGQGCCVQFPILIINKPPQVLEAPDQPSSS